MTILSLNKTTGIMSGDGRAASGLCRMALRYRTDIAAPFFCLLAVTFVSGWGTASRESWIALNNANVSKKVRYIVTAALIAAFYAAITFVFQPLSYGYVQIRISEILTVLPAFTPAAIPGLFIGCIVSNLASPFGPVDIAVGSLATLLAAFLSSKMPSKWLVPLPPVVCNGVIVGIELHYLLHTPLILSMLSVAGGEAIACYAGGIPLMFALKKVSRRLFG